MVEATGAGRVVFVERDRKAFELLGRNVAALRVEAEAELGDSGRVLLRPSGTESLVRVMVEATSQERAEQIAGRLAVVVREQLAL